MRDLSGPTDFYRVFDENWSTLYVGVSQNAYERFRQHRRTSAWWPMAEWFKIDRFYTREHALRTEAVFVQLDEPPFNTDQCAAKFELGWADIQRGIISYATIEKRQLHFSELRMSRG